MSLKTVEGSVPGLKARLKLSLYSIKSPCSSIKGPNRECVVRPQQRMCLNSTNLKVALSFTNVLNNLPVLGLHFGLLCLPTACSLNWKGLAMLPDEHTVKM